MARLPLLINGKRIKTLEELRENFQLAELIERYRGGQLRAWLNCWDFEEEQKQLELLSADLPELELAESLCNIFKVEGVFMERALADFMETRKKLEQERQIELQHQQEQQKQEDERKADQTRELTLDEIEFTWEEATSDQEFEYVANGPDRFVSLVSGTAVYYSYDGIRWEKPEIKMDNPERNGQVPYASNLSVANGIYVAGWTGGEFYYSHDLTNWRKIEIDGEELGGHLPPSIIRWTGEQYVALCGKEEPYTYSKKVLFMTTQETSYYPKPMIYVSDKIEGPWYRATLNKHYFGDVFTDFIFFNDRFIFTGHKDATWEVLTDNTGEQFKYVGSSVADLKASLFNKELTSADDSCLWIGNGKCFRCSFSFLCGLNGDVAYVSADGDDWDELKYGIAQLIEAGGFLIARLFKPGSCASAKDLGFHCSLDGVNWKKLDAPLNEGKLAYQNGKLLIVSGTKIAVGTLKRPAGK